MKRWSSHGFSTTPVYRVWAAMVQRCTNPNNKQFKDYGGRGISICDRWLRDAAAFISDMGTRPEGCQIERIDNDGNYEPRNCKWATVDRQVRNKRNNVWVEIKGERMILQDWCKRIGIPFRTVTKRLAKGRSIEDALFDPIVNPVRGEFGRFERAA